MIAKQTEVESTDYSEDYREDPVDDESETDNSTAVIRYQISSYGIDFDVKGLVERLKGNKVFIPEFQRSFVWSMRDASLFIESLLLGLPVPGVFLAKERESNRLIVIDGQQRLKSLQYFYGGHFNPKPERKTQRVFRLTGVQKKFKDKTYAELDESDRQALDDSAIHATIVKQESPADDDTSIYHVYGRLNSGGRKLHPQEIRTAVSQGSFINKIRALNNDAAWRQLFGPKSPRLKDEEMVLRFFAFMQDAGNYERPMSEFLNIYTEKHKSMESVQLDGLVKVFEETMSMILKALGDKAFRLERNFNAAVFDSVAVGVARRLSCQQPKPTPGELKSAYDALMLDDDYREAVSRSTADNAFVERRIRLSTEAFSKKNENT